MGNSFLPLSMCCHGACAYFLYSLLFLFFDLFCSSSSPNPSPTTTILESFWLFLCSTKPENRPSKHDKVPSKLSQACSRPYFIPLHRKSDYFFFLKNPLLLTAPMPFLLHFYDLNKEPVIICSMKPCIIRSLVFQYKTKNLKTKEPLVFSIFVSKTKTEKKDNGLLFRFLFYKK